MISVAILFSSSSLRVCWPEHPPRSVAERSTATHGARNIKAEMLISCVPLQLSMQREHPASPADHLNGSKATKALFDAEVHQSIILLSASASYNFSLNTRRLIWRNVAEMSSCFSNTSSDSENSETKRRMTAIPYTKTPPNTSNGDWNSKLQAKVTPT